MENISKISIVPQTVVTGSTIDRFKQSIDLRISDKSIEWQKEVYITQDHTNKIYIRNKSAWCRTVNLTCASPWNSGGGPRQAGTLVTPQHLLCAAHYGLWSGTVRFVANNGQVFDNAIVGRNVIPNTDILVVKLENPLPNLIKPAMLLPPNASEYIPVGSNIPVLTLDQEEKALISLIGNINANGYISTMRPFASPEKEKFYEDKISGDSGNPVFIVYGDNVIMLTHLQFGGAGAGPSYVTNYQKIIDMINTLGGNTNVATFDFAVAASSPSTPLTLNSRYFFVTPKIFTVADDIELKVERVNIEQTGTVIKTL